MSGTNPQAQPTHRVKVPTEEGAPLAKNFTEVRDPKTGAISRVLRPEAVADRTAAMKPRLIPAERRNMYFDSSRGPVKAESKSEAEPVLEDIEIPEKKKPGRKAKSEARG